MTEGAAARKWPVKRILIWVAATILAIPLTYFLAALLLGAVPANAGWRQPEEGVTIFVRTNGVHTWIMVPTVTPEMDWRPFAPAEHLADPRYAANHVAFGYGNREFYLNTSTWGDLTLGTALGAAVGNGTTLMHVEHVHDPAPDEHQRPLQISRDQYRRLARFIRAGFRLDAEGRTIPLRGRGYAGWDMFYEANGRYNLFLTCNEWTGRALRAAGIRMGLWTPLEQSIMWRLD